MLEGIWDAILPYILEIVLSTISIIVARYVIPFIKGDLIPWLKEKRLYNIVKKFVQAAEKMAESNIIQKSDKKAMVIKLLEDKGIIVDEITEAIIEGCVKELDLIVSAIHKEVVGE